MASESICPKCEGCRFEMASADIRGARFDYTFVRCHDCGTVVGVLPGKDTNALLNTLAERLNVEL